MSYKSIESRDPLFFGALKHKRKTTAKMANVRHQSHQRTQGDVLWQRGGRGWLRG
jgi:hypothetical protein